MAEPLRARQKAMAEESILQALADLVAESGSLEVPVAQVAERAGVSHRTVYNHFGDRDGLIDALYRYCGERMDAQGGTDLPEHLADLPAVIPANYRAIDAVAPLAMVLSRVDHATRTGGDHRSRNRRVVELVERAHPEIDEQAATMVAAAVRQLVGTQPWYRLTREHGLTTEQAAAAAAWTVRLVVEALARGDLPAEEGP